MLHLKDRSAVLADFARHWQNVGGAACSPDDLMLPEILPRMIVACRRDGVWNFEYAGQMHDEISGLSRVGPAQAHIPPHIWTRTSAMFERCMETGMGQVIETTGFVGRSVDLLVRFMRVPCAPLRNAEATISVVTEWEFSLDPAQEEVLAELVGRCAGPALRQQFVSDRPGVARVSAQLALLREIVGGFHGHLSPADQTYLQIFLLGLTREFDTDGEALYEIH